MALTIQNDILILMLEQVRDTAGLRLEDGTVLPVFENLRPPMIGGSRDRLTIRDIRRRGYSMTQVLSVLMKDLPEAVQVSVRAEANANQLALYESIVEYNERRFPIRRADHRTVYRRRPESKMRELPEKERLVNPLKSFELVTGDYLGVPAIRKGDLVRINCYDHLIDVGRVEEFV